MDLKKLKMNELKQLKEIRKRIKGVFRLLKGRENSLSEDIVNNLIEIDGDMIDILVQLNLIEMKVKSDIYFSNQYYNDSV